MIQQPDHRYAAVNSVKTTGDTSQMAVGQVALAFENRIGLNGHQVVDVTQDELVFPKSERFVFRFGLPGGKPYRGKGDTHIGATIPFDKEHIGKLGVASPKSQQLTVDKIIIGYDGVDDFKSPVMYPGETRKVTVEIYGSVVSLMGYEDGIATFEYTVTAPECDHNRCIDCDPCDPVDMLPLFEKLRDSIANTITASGRKLGEFIGVSLISKSDSPVDYTTVPTKLYNVTVPEICGKKTIDYVQSSTEFKVVQIGSDTGAGTATFQIKVPATVASYTPEDVVVRAGNILPACDGTCPTGYDAASGASGYLYTIEFAPDTQTASDLISNFPGTVLASKTVYENKTRNEGTIVIVSEAVVDKEMIDSYIQDYSVNAEFDRKVTGVCISDTENTYAWVEGEGCEVAQFMFYLTQEVQPCGNETETQAAARILADLKTTYPLNNIQQVGQVVNCIAKYSAQVYSNEVCTNCTYTKSDIYRVCSIPNYKGAVWYCEPSTTTTPANNLVGIKLEGRWLQTAPGNCLRGRVPIYYDSIRLRAGASGGEMNVVGRLARTLKPWFVSVVSNATEEAFLGHKLQVLVDKDLEYYIAEHKTNNYLRNSFLGMDYFLEPFAPYVDYWVTLYNVHTRENGYHVNQGITYHFIVKFGEHEEVENMMNKLAQIGGKDPVYASTAVGSDPEPDPGP